MFLTKSTIRVVNSWHEDPQPKHHHIGPLESICGGESDLKSVCCEDWVSFYVFMSAANSLMDVSFHFSQPDVQPDEPSEAECAEGPWQHDHG